MGRGRSGSTFLENQITKRSGAVLLGESRLWPSCYQDDIDCTCGQCKASCPIWRALISDNKHRPTVQASFEKSLSRRFLLALLLPRFFMRRVFGQDIANLGAFYEPLSSLRPGQLIIDSSKNPAFGYALTQTDSLDVQFLHIVRHPLGVVYSWKRQRERNPDVPLYRVRKPLMLAALQWTISNLFCEIAKFRSLGVHRLVRYEDLADAEKLDSLVASYAVAGNDKNTSEIHAMSGNPGKASRSGSFVIDDDWKTSLRWWEKLVYGSVTYPLFLLYRLRQT